MTVQQISEQRLALRPEEVASRIGLGITLTRSLIRRGEIRSFRVGRAILVPEEEVRRFVTDRLATG